MFDPTELARLQAKLLTLENLRDQGVLSIRTPEGRSISYQSGADLRAAIAALRADIAAYIGDLPTRRRTFRIQQRGQGF